MMQILNRETALATAAVYEAMFAAEDGTIPATFQVMQVDYFMYSARNTTILTWPNL